MGNKQKFIVDGDVFVVANVLKSTGVMWLPATPVKQYDSLQEATEEAKRRASTGSADYKYVVVKLERVLEAERTIPPVKVTLL